MELHDVLPPIFLAHVETELAVNFVKENVAAVAVFDHAVARRAIAGEHDDFVRRLEPVAVSFLPGTMMNGERFHSYVPVLVNDAGLNLVHVHFVTGPVAVLEAVSANGDVFAVSGEQMVGHRFKSSGTIGLERIFSAENPRTEDEIGVTERVIGMKVSHEKRLEILNGKTGDAFPGRRARATNNARTTIDQIRRIIDDDRNRRAGAVRVGAGISGAEHHHLRARWSDARRRCLRETRRERERYQQ